MITLKLKDLNDNAKLKPGATIKVKAITMTTPGRWTVTGEVTKTTLHQLQQQGLRAQPQRGGLPPGQGRRGAGTEPRGVSYGCQSPHLRVVQPLADQGRSEGSMSRILGFSTKDWPNHRTGMPKLQSGSFTTFRFVRKDRAMKVGEVVQVVVHPRMKAPGRVILGNARVVAVDPRWLITPEWADSPAVLAATIQAAGIGLTDWSDYELVKPDEALEDGFLTVREMFDTIGKMYQYRQLTEPMVKLTLVWVDVTEAWWDAWA